MPVATSEIYRSPGVDVKTDQGVTPDIDVQSVQQISVVALITALSGGTAPAVTFMVDRKELDGSYTQIGAGSAINGQSGSPNTNITKLEVGPGLPINVMLPKTIRIRWGVTGAPTTATGTFMITGR